VKKWDAVFATLSFPAIGPALTLVSVFVDHIHTNTRSSDSSTYSLVYIRIADPDQNPNPGDKIATVFIFEKIRSRVGSSR
jgi:hypothetical protein